MFKITAQEKRMILCYRTLSEKSIKEGAFLVVRCPKTRRYLMGLRAKGTNNAGKWGLFGGNVDKGEKPIKAIKREWKEETNLKAPSVKKLVTLKIKRSGRIMHFFQGELSSDIKIPLNKKEHSRYKWFNLKKVPSPAQTNVPAKTILKYLLKQKSS